MTDLNAFTPTPGPLADGVSSAFQIAKDITRRGLIWAPIAIIASAAIWGWPGGTSAAYAIAIVVVNFLLSAWLLQTAGRISPVAMGGAALFGYLLRLGLIFLAVMLVKDASWIDVVPLGLVLIATHLGLLFWELRFVSGSMAYPGLKPRQS